MTLRKNNPGRDPRTGRIRTRRKTYANITRKPRRK